MSDENNKNGGILSAEGLNPVVNMQKLERLIIIREQINKGRCPTVDDFCRMFEVQRRTVHEDIRAVREMFGDDIKWDAFKGGYVNHSPNQKLLEFDLNDGEVFALTLG